jgi:hypothetical protein
MHQAEIIVVLFAAGRADIQTYRAEAPLPPGHICNQAARDYRSELFCIAGQYRPILKSLAYGRKWHHRRDPESQKRRGFFDLTGRNGF